MLMQIDGVEFHGEMTDESEGGVWPAAALAAQMQEASEQAVKQQSELFERFLSMSTGRGLDDYSQLSATALETATFKCRVQSGGRISIPDAERDALDIQEGDLVQTIVIPIERETK